MTVDDTEMRARIGEVLNRWPSAGLAVGVVRDGALAWFHGHGYADVETATPVDEDTVFRIASLTKTMTAVAVMQLWEQGLVDLDAPVDDVLRSYALVPADSAFRPATIRDLLTHTAGVRAVRGPADLFRPTLGWGRRVGHPLPELAEYYRGGLRADFAPGSRWAYSNHGYATLGQIVEDVTGLPFDRYLRDHVFEPLGMDSSDLVRTERVRHRLATGYTLRSRGLAAVTDREVVTAGASSAYSTTRDLARYAAALLGGGSNEHGSVLKPETVALMFEPHYQPDPRLPGMGLGFFRGEIGGHLTLGHDGIWTGFLSDLLLVPDEGVGVIGLANTGAFEPRGSPTPAVHAVVRCLFDLPEDSPRADVPERPWTWKDLCGYYALGPGVLADPQPRQVLGGGVEVFVRRGELRARGQMPVPAVRRGLRLHPTSDDPDAFLLDLSVVGLGLATVVFRRDPSGEVEALCVDAMPMSFRKRPGVRNPRLWVSGGIAAGATAVALGRLRRRATAS